MLDNRKTRLDLIKLATGERVLRLTDLQSGFSLEKTLSGGDIIARQKDRLVLMLEAALARAGFQAA
jgi:hypothetical protein